MAASATRRTSSRIVTSATMGRTLEPDCDAAARNGSPRRATRTRLEPSAPSRCASAAPIPALAPVMTMTFSRTCVLRVTGRWPGYAENVSVDLEHADGDALDVATRAEIVALCTAAY